MAWSVLKPRKPLKYLRKPDTTEIHRQSTEADRVRVRIAFLRIRPVTLYDADVRILKIVGCAENNG